LTQRNYPLTVLAQARTLAGAIKTIDPALQIGELTNAALEADLERSIVIQHTLSELEIQLIEQRNRRDELYGEIWKKVKRLRAGVKGIYGDDSSEYEMAGGTRLSERKPRSRKKAVDVPQT
jgi:hypothetical protein